MRPAPRWWSRTGPATLYAYHLADGSAVPGWPRFRRRGGYRLDPLGRAAGREHLRFGLRGRRRRRRPGPSALTLAYGARRSGAWTHQGRRPGGRPAPVVRRAGVAHCCQAARSARTSSPVPWTSSLTPSTPHRDRSLPGGRFSAPTASFPPRPSPTLRGRASRSWWWAGPPSVGLALGQAYSRAATSG